MDGILDVDADRSARAGRGRAVGRGMKWLAVKVRPEIEREQGGGRLPVCGRGFVAESRCRGPSADMRATF
jgi:hypothetical protein